MFSSKIVQFLLTKSGLVNKRREKKITTQLLNYVVARFMRASDPIRTGDLLITSELLYLLSHTSIF